ncbi:unnamed protein product [Polarella glacialis]|uniref:Acyltransferase 3 domain-containing protein n=1 Tax=Polarella glacialis TaxID=89957 RepID=A0A813FGZ9_POLGL|nr:unnamed protein product [Polarella glacialis]
MVPLFVSDAKFGFIGNANNWLAFGSTVSYWNKDDDNFNDINPFLPLWSLGVEEQFYVVFPFILWAGRSSPSQLCAALVGLSTLSLAFAIWLESNGLTTHAFFLMPARFWELAAGSLLLLFSGPLQEWLASKTWTFCLLEILAVAFMAAAMAATPEGIGFPAPWALPAVAGSLLCIGLGLDPRSKLSQMLSSSCLVYLGRLSYSIYLWHMPVLGVLRLTQAQLPVMTTCLVLPLLSMASFHCLEEPIRRHRSKDYCCILGTAAAATAASWVWLVSMDAARSTIQPELHMVYLGIALIFLLAGLGVAWHAPCQPTSKLVFLSVLLLSVMAVPVSVAAQAGSGGKIIMTSSTYYEQGLADSCLCQFKENSTLHKPKGARSTASPSAQSLPMCFEEEPVTQQSFESLKRWGSNCTMTSPSLEYLDYMSACLQPEASNAIYVLGDSHSQTMHLAFELATNWPVHRLSWLGFWGEVIFIGAEASQEEQLEALDLTVPKILKKSDILAYVVHADMANQTLFVKNLLHSSRSAGSRLLLVLDYPWLKEDPKRCLLSSTEKCRMSADEVENQIKDQRALVEAFRSEAGVYVFNSHELFLDADNSADFPVPGTNTEAYFDQGHINDAGSRYLAPFLCSFLQDLTRVRANHTF